MVAEVHDPRCHARTDDERPADRLRFYDRTDATVLGPWVQPALTSDGDRVRGMLLLDLFRSEPAVPAHLLGEFTETYFVFAEGAEPVDAEYAELRRRLAAATPGPGVAIDDLDLVPLLDVDPGR